jgi:hypothetical protein
MLRAESKGAGFSYANASLGAADDVTAWDARAEDNRTVNLMPDCAGPSAGERPLMHESGTGAGLSHPRGRVSHKHLVSPNHQITSYAGLSAQPPDLASPPRVRARHRVPRNGDQSVTIAMQVISRLSGGPSALGEAGRFAHAFSLRRDARGSCERHGPSRYLPSAPQPRCPASSSRHPVPADRRAA